jgi:hypothetical protein
VEENVSFWFDYRSKANDAFRIRLIPDVYRRIKPKVRGNAVAPAHFSSSRPDTNTKPFEIYQRDDLPIGGEKAEVILRGTMHNPQHTILVILAFKFVMLLPTLDTMLVPAVKRSKSDAVQIEA